MGFNTVIGFAVGLLLSFSPQLLSELDHKLKLIPQLPQTIERTKNFSIELGNHFKPYTPILIENWKPVLLKFDELVPNMLLTESGTISNGGCYEGLNGSAWWTHNPRGLLKLVSITVRIKWPSSNVILTQSWNSTLTHPLKPVDYSIEPQIHPVEKCAQNAQFSEYCDINFNVFPYGRTCWKFSYEQNKVSHENVESVGSAVNVQSVSWASGFGSYMITNLLLAVILYFFRPTILGIILNIVFYPSIVLTCNSLMFDNMSWFMDWLPLYLTLGVIITLILLLFAKKSFSRYCGLNLRLLSLGLIMYNVQIPTYGLFIAVFMVITHCFSLCGESEVNPPSKKSRYEEVNKRATQQGLDELRTQLKAMTPKELRTKFPNMPEDQLKKFISGESDGLFCTDDRPVDHNHEGAQIPADATGDSWRQHYFNKN